jgi:AraC-like DNA-binding protein
MFDGEAGDFLRRFIFPGNTDYRFIRFVPKDNAPQISAILEQLLTEMWRPEPGGTYLIIGFVERLLSLLPAEYTVTVERNDRNAASNASFEEIRRYLEDHYQETTLYDLIEKFGYDMNYFNRLIKNHTGMTYSHFLQNIRLEKAEMLLKTTGFTIEEIARKGGYENLTYFYKIFQEKFSLSPKDLRKSQLS